MKLDELRVLVTGGARGMGRHFCLALAEAGAHVATLDIDEAGLKSLEADAASVGHGVKTFRADLAVEKEVVGAVDAAWDALGSLNGLINNAGIYRDSVLVKSVAPGTALRFPLKQWQRVIDVDLTGTFLATREVAAKMVENDVKPGVFVNISSVSRFGNIGQSNYSAAKAAVVANARGWARELAPHGIRVAAIAPGFIRTPILEGMATGKLDEYVSRVPLGRIGEPKEIFAGIRFIVECDYFTGRCIDIDGGFDF